MVIAKIHGIMCLAEACGRHLQRVEHFAGGLGMDAVGGDAGDDHGDGLLDALRVVQGVQDVGAEAGAGAEGGPAGAAELLVEVAEGAAGERGRVAEAAVGLGVAAERVGGAAFGHGFLLWCARCVER